MNSEEANLTLNNQNIQLLKFLFQVLLELSQVFTGGGGILADYPIDHNLIPVSNIAKFPESLVCLRKIGQSVKMLQEPNWSS
jgi:hypothetical protein